MFTVCNCELLVYCYRLGSFAFYIHPKPKGRRFSVFLTSLENIVPWMFSLDHIHYARCLPVPGGLEKMSNESNTLLQFNKGYFIVSKTDYPFSSMAVDQAHK